MSHEHIREALGRATPGPWAYHADQHRDDGRVWRLGGDGDDICRLAYPDREADAHLIANAPTWLAELLAEVDNARRELGDVHVSLYSEIAMLTARAKAAEQVVRRVRGMAEAWATQPTDYDEGTEQQIEDGKAILRALDGGAS